MPNLWGNKSNFKNGRELLTFILGLVIFIIILHLLFPSLFTNISSMLNSTSSAISSNNINLPETNEQNTVNSSVNSNQISSDFNSTLTTGNVNNELATGYWIIFSLNGALQQLPVNSQDFAFIQEFIQKDSKTSSTNAIYLVQNSQIHKYLVSNELFSIISNLEIIYTRDKNNSTNSSTSSSNTSSITTTPTPISETLNVSSVTTAGFTVTLNPTLNGLTTNNFTLVDSSGNKITITSATTSNDGVSYTITASLGANQTYTLTASATGYTFGTPRNVVVPQ
jgi:hypothetical protein